MYILHNKLIIVEGFCQPVTKYICEFTTRWNELYRNLVHLIRFKINLATCIFYIIYKTLELKPIVVAIQWALVRTYWIDEPLEW